jgi:exodeoxyribonuclease VIII
MNIDINFLNERPLSYSSLKEFAKSPSHYIHYVLAKREPSKEMALGSMVHCLILQPDEFNKQFAVSPSVDRRTSEGKAKYAEFVSQSEGKTVVFEDDLELANQISYRVLFNDTIQSYLRQCDSFEHEFKLELNGLPVRGFIDGISNDFTIELKTTSDANPETFMRDFWNRKYYLQAGIYYLATGVKPMYIVAETKAPYNYFICHIEDEYIEMGVKEAHSLTEKFNECMSLSAWNTGYEFMAEKPIVIKAPGWVK